MYMGLLLKVTRKTDMSTCVCVTCQHVIYCKQTCMLQSLTCISWLRWTCEFLSSDMQIPSHDLHFNMCFCTVDSTCTFNDLITCPHVIRCGWTCMFKLHQITCMLSIETYNSLSWTWTLHCPGHGLYTLTANLFVHTFFATRISWIM